MNAVPIGVTGRITNHPIEGDGPRHGWLVRVEDDRDGSGGLYVLTWREDERVGFDNWLEDVSLVPGFFEFRGWVVDWTLSGLTGPSATLTEP